MQSIMRNAGLEEAQAGIKIAGRSINNLRYADDITLMAESEEELKSLLKVKQESEKAGLKLNIQNQRSWHPVPSLHGKKKGKRWTQQQSSSSLSAIRVVSSAYLRLLILLPAILIPAWASSSPAFLMMYSAHVK